MKKMNPKKWICLCALILALLPLLCLVMPVYVLKDDASFKRYYCQVWDFFAKASVSSVVIFSISLGVFAILSIVAMVHFVKALRAQPDVGDDEDKHFIFGFAFMILGNAVMGISMFGQSHYIPMVWSLLYAIGGIVMIVVHFKKLSVA